MSCYTRLARSHPAPTISINELAATAPLWKTVIFQIVLPAISIALPLAAAAAAATSAPMALTMTAQAAAAATTTTVDACANAAVAAIGLQPITYLIRMPSRVQSRMRSATSPPVVPITPAKRTSQTRLAPPAPVRTRPLSPCAARGGGNLIPEDPAQTQSDWPQRDFPASAPSPAGRKWSAAKGCKRQWSIAG